MLSLPTRLKQRGDTIVEVLISVAIISSVLAGAFLVTQRSVVAVRDSQEHAEMTQLLQGQVEQVRALALQETSDTAGVFATTPKYFCIATSGVKSGERINFAGSATLESLNSYPPECRGIQSFYAVAISYNATTKVFNFSGNWDAMGGGTNNENFAYRIYPAFTAASIPAAPAGASGNAAVIITPCVPNPITGSCAPAGPPQYYFQTVLTNTSNNPGKTAVSCEWAWSDGSKDTYSCAPGDQLTHVWASPPGIQPYPVDCGSYAGYVILTLTLDDGQKPSVKYDTPYPSCF